MAVEAKASRVLAKASTASKNDALREMAKVLRKRSKRILTANRLECAAVRKTSRSAAFVERMTLNGERIEGIARALEHVAKLPDPVGRTTDFAKRPNGLVIRKMRVPLGVVAIIYESRPGVTADAAGLCIKSGNAAILRGGKETVKANLVISQALREGLRKAGLPAGSVGFVNDPDRAAVKRLCSWTLMTS